MNVLPGWSPFSVVDDRRAHTVYSVLAPHSEGTFHFLVDWDEDRDPRVLGAALALYYKFPRLFECVVTWRESKACLAVQAINRTIVKSQEPHPFVTSSELELKRALHAIVTEDTFAIEHDSWEVEVVCIKWPLSSEIHRLHKLGLQLPPSVQEDIRADAPVVVTYATEAKCAKNGGTAARIPQAMFGTLEEAVAARFPHEATMARIPVEGGCLVRRAPAPAWEFHRD